jgi:ribosomal protein S18 acetylase RimI-like enzyme
MHQTVAKSDTTVKSLMVAETKRLIQPDLEQVLTFCADDPVERVYLEEAARRGLGRLVATVEDGRVTALCHLGANVVPSGRGCEVFADATVAARPRMLIGNEAAVSELWAAVRDRMPTPRDDRPGQPVFSIADTPEPGETGIRPATTQDLDLLLPACAATHYGELGLDPVAADSEGFRRRTLQQIDEGRSWIWLEGETILFKAEASAWTNDAVQLQQVWVDPAARNRQHGQRGLRDLIRLLLEEVPRVCLFVRADNPAAIRLYEAVGMRRAGTYRSILF